LRLSSGLTISVLVARSLKVWKSRIRWQIDPVRHERNLVALLARLDKDNQEFLDFHVFPNMDRHRRFRVSLNDEWLSRGKVLTKLSDFCEVVTQVRKRRR
jgi:hypothetical protein